MNVKKIVIVSVISLLVAFSSCNTLRKNNNYHWKIGKKMKTILLFMAN